jgi:hypothetical protein
VSIQFTPSFKHTDWVDNLDRVQAGGTNGFNIRFQGLLTDLGALAAVVQQINAALVALGTKPPPTPDTLSLTPVLATNGPKGWLLLKGIVQKDPTGTTANGLMPVTLPGGAVILRLLASGRNVGTGTLTITLFKQSVASLSQPLQLAVVNGAGVFNQVLAPAPPQEQVDNDKFKYFIQADLNGAGLNDDVQITGLQIVYLPTQS